ncbi:MAG: nucleotidyltransferase domain-containing protein [Armatimonadetes bacterium]|nr:nucleotidyltransferase domain-containing protein [Armatimonadota bacterium]
MAEIEAVGRQIGEEHQAEQVILFGSHARGTAGPDSDVDLLVVLPYKGSRARQAATIRFNLRPGFPIDLLVRTPDEVRQRVALGDPFVIEVLTQGRLLYGSADSRVG